MRPNNHLTHDARTSKEEQAVEARVRLMPSWIDITDITDVTSDSGEKIGKVRLREVHMRDLHSRTGSEATYIEHPGGARTEKPGRRPIYRNPCALRPGVEPALIRDRAGVNGNRGWSLAGVVKISS